jgi:endoglucanase
MPVLVVIAQYSKSFSNMRVTQLISGLLLGVLVSAVPSPSAKRAAATLPFSTKGRDIVDAKGDVFHYKSTNWPGD